MIRRLNYWAASTLETIHWQPVLLFDQFIFCTVFDSPLKVRNKKSVITKKIYWNVHLLLVITCWWLASGFDLDGAVLHLEEEENSR